MNEGNEQNVMEFKEMLRSLPDILESENAGGNQATTQTQERTILKPKYTLFGEDQGEELEEVELEEVPDSNGTGRSNLHVRLWGYFTDILYSIHCQVRFLR